MWKVRQHLVEAPEFRRLNVGFARYLFFLIVWFNYLTSLPWPSTQLKHKQALEDLLLDEEFPNVDNMKKNFYDVATVEEMWQWARGPLGQAVLSDDSNPGSLVAMLGANQVVGPVRLRQSRVKSLSARVAQASTQGDADGVACGAVDGVGGCCAAPNSAECRFDFAKLSWGNPAQYGWSESSQHDRALYCVEYPLDVKCSACDDVMHQELARGTFAKDCTTDAPVFEPWLPYGKKALKGSRSFVDNQWGFAVEVFGDGAGNDLNVSEFMTEINLMDVVKTRANGSTGIDRLQEVLTDIEEGKKPFKVDIHTRAMSFQFVLYSGHHSTAGGRSDLANVLTWVSILFFIEPSGHLSHYSRITPIPVPNSCFLQTNQTLTFAWLDTTVKARCMPDTLVKTFLAPVFSWDFFWLATALLSILWLVGEEIDEIMYDGGKIVTHFLEWWNFVELLFFAAFIAYCCSVVEYRDELTAAVDSMVERPHAFTDLSRVRTAYLRHHWLLGIFLFVVVFKVAKFVRVTASLRILWRTLEYAVVDLFFFMFNLALLLTAFGLCGMYAYGTSVVGYHNMLASISAWTRTAVGEGNYDYDEMSAAWPMTAPFLIFFVIIVVVIAMNTFIAILSASYDDAKSESAEWTECRRKLRSHYTNDERGLYNEPQDLVDLYELVTDYWTRFVRGMQTHLYGGYSLGSASGQQVVHHLQEGDQVWIKLDSAMVPDDSPSLARVGSHLNRAGAATGGTDDEAASNLSIEIHTDMTDELIENDQHLFSEQQLFAAVEKEADITKRSKLFIRNKIESLQLLQHIGWMRRALTKLWKSQRLAKEELGANTFDPAAHMDTTFQLRLNGEHHTVAYVRLHHMARTINDLGQHKDAHHNPEVFPGFVQLNRWVVTEVYDIQSWHTLHTDPKIKTLRVCAHDEMYWIISWTTYMQLIKLRFADFFWYICQQVLQIATMVLTLGLSWLIIPIIRCCCCIQQNSEDVRRQKLRRAVTQFLRARAKQLGARNPDSGNVFRSMRFYLKENITLEELVEMLQYHIFHPPRVWRLDQRVYRFFRPTVGSDTSNFNDTDRRLLFACFNDPELFRMNLLEYQPDGTDRSATMGHRTAWMDNQEASGDRYAVLQDLKQRLQAISAEAQRVSSGLGPAHSGAQDWKRQELLKATGGIHSGTNSICIQVLCCS